MEARTAFRTSAVSRGLVAVVVLVLAALMLGAAGGYLAKSLSLPVKAPAAHVTDAQQATPDFSDEPRITRGRSGPQTMDDGASTQSSASTSSQEQRSLRAGPQS